LGLNVIGGVTTRAGQGFLDEKFKG